MSVPVVYVLDDSAAMLEMAGLVLDGVGDVRRFTEWPELALPLLRARDGDVLVTDWNLGDDGAQRGGQLCELMRREKPNLQLVVFTGSPELVPDGVPDVVVPKTPGCLATLREVVNELLPGTDRAANAPRGTGARRDLHPR